MPRKSTKRRRKPTKRPPKKQPVTFYKVTRYRSPKTGRFTKIRRKKWAETTEYIRVPRKLPIPIKKTTKREVIRSITQFDLDNWQGDITNALLGSNVATQLDGAKWVTVTIRGRGPDRKIKTMIADLQLGVIRRKADLFSAIVFKITDMLSANNLRVQYNLNEIRWTGKMTRKKDAAARQILEDVTITIHIER